ncbi:hypothetical protein ACJA27_00155 [Mycoplasmopsis lipophila]|uniref:hypothetical protein n=1 Tax=Mycoplasmopsis lipophila TaxID=2117 RepID=UPI003872B54F
MNKKISLFSFAIIIPFFTIYNLSSKCNFNKEKNNFLKEFNSINNQLKLQFIKSNNTQDFYWNQLDVDSDFDFEFSSKELEKHFLIKKLYFTFSENNVFYNYQIFNKKTMIYSPIYKKEIKVKTIDDKYKNIEKNIDQLLNKINNELSLNDNKNKLKKQIQEYQNIKNQILNDENLKRKYQNVIDSYNFFIEMIEKENNEFKLIKIFKQLKNSGSNDFLSNNSLIEKYLNAIELTKNIFLLPTATSFIENIIKENKYNEFRGSFDNDDDFKNNPGSGIYKLFIQMNFWKDLNEKEKWNEAKNQINKIIEESNSKCMVVSFIKKWCPDCNRFKKEIAPQYQKKYTNDKFVYFDLETNSNQQKIYHLMLSILNSMGAKKYLLRVPYTVFIYKGKIIANGTEINTLDKMESLRRIYENNFDW